MKKDQIRVDGKLTVRILAIREVPQTWRDGRWNTPIHVINTAAPSR